jgi:hypothetical protein
MVPGREGRRRRAGERRSAPGGVNGRGREHGGVAASKPETTWTLEQSRAAGSGSWAPGEACLRALLHR